MGKRGEETESKGKTRGERQKEVRVYLQRGRKDGKEKEEIKGRVEKKKT